MDIEPWEGKAVENVPLNVFVLVSHERWGAERAVRLLKLMGFGTFTVPEFEGHKKRLISNGINLEQRRRLIQARLAKATFDADFWKIAERLRAQRLMLASLNLMN